MPARDRLGWFRWCPKDHVGDPAVRAMTRDERAGYDDVLWALYMANTGTATEDMIRVWAGYDEAAWPAHREAFARAFRIGRRGRWTQRRVELEVKAAQRRVKTAVESGKKGGGATASKRRTSLGLLQRPYGETTASLERQDD
jgi:uncharacterized protein YdaU (DUF1376 family)